MRFKVTHTPTEDAFEIESESIETVQLRVFVELKQRNWKQEDCFSTQLEDL